MPQLLDTAPMGSTFIPAPGTRPEPAPQADTPIARAARERRAQTLAEYRDLIAIHEPTDKQAAKILDLAERLGRTPEQVAADQRRLADLADLERQINETQAKADAIDLAEINARLDEVNAEIADAEAHLNTLRGERNGVTSDAARRRAAIETTKRLTNQAEALRRSCGLYPDHPL